MKILYLVKSLRPHHEYDMARLASELARELAALGHEVYAVSTDRDSAGEVTFKGVGFATHHYPSPYPFFAYDDSLEDVLSNVALSSQLVKLVETQGPFDLVHGFGWNAGLAGAFLHRVKGVPFVLSLSRSCQVDSQRGEDRVASWVGEMSKWLSSRADRILIPSHYPDWRANFLGVEGHKIDVTEPGVRLEDFSAKVDLEEFRSLFADHGTKVVLHAGRLTRAKGLEALVESLRSLPPTLAKVRLVIAGDGPGRSALEVFAQERGLKERVHFTGALHTIVLGALYRAADVFVDPSDQGPGFAAFEAASLGTPVVGLEHSFRPASTGLAGSGRFYPCVNIDPHELCKSTARALLEPRSASTSELRHSSWRQSAETVVRAYQALTSEMSYTGATAQ